MVERVARRGAKVGEKFYGCRAYPQCRGTRPFPVATPVASPDVALDRALDRDVAGGSARATFERRQMRHKEWQRSVRGRVLAVAAAGIFIGLVWFASGARIYVLPSIFGLYLALLSVAWAVGLLIGTPQSIRAWRTGAGGEEKTAAWLATLPEGWIVLHDRKLPRSQANIDHIAIGPPGVFVIETKDFGGKLNVSRGEVYVAGRRRTAIVDQALREGTGVAGVLADLKIEVPVYPVLCVHRADLPWRAPTIRSVPIRSGRGLVRHLAEAEAKMDPPTVLAVAAHLDRALRRP